MFRSLATLRSSFTRSRLAFAGATLAAVGAAAPLMGAGPWDWQRGPHGREIEVRIEPRREVRIEYRPQVLAIAPIEVAPCDVNITAYQSHGTIMVFATGTNRTGGFGTALRALDCRDASPRIQLSNVAPCGYTTQCLTPFSINAALHIDRCVSTIEVVSGGRVICVPVQQVAGIS